MGQKDTQSEQTIDNPEPDNNEQAQQNQLTKEKTTTDNNIIPEETDPLLEEPGNNASNEMDTIMEGLNKVEQAVQNSSTDKMDVIMEGLNKVEDLIEHDSLEQMDSIMEGEQKNNGDERSDETNTGVNLRRRTAHGDKVPNTPTTNQQKPKPKKHHRPDPLDTPI